MLLWSEQQSYKQTGGIVHFRESTCLQWQALTRLLLLLLLSFRSLSARIKQNLLFSNTGRFANSSLWQGRNKMTNQEALSHVKRKWAGAAEYTSPSWCEVHEWFLVSSLLPAIAFQLSPVVFSWQGCWGNDIYWQTRDLGEGMLTCLGEKKQWYYAWPVIFELLPPNEPRNR